MNEASTAVTSVSTGRGRKAAVTKSGKPVAEVKKEQKVLVDAAKGNAKSAKALLATAEKDLKGFIKADTKAVAVQAKADAALAKSPKDAALKEAAKSAKDAVKKTQADIKAGNKAVETAKKGIEKAGAALTKAEAAAAKAIGA